MSFSCLVFVLLEYIHVLFELCERFGVFFNSLGIYKWLLLEGIGMDLVIFGGDTSFFLRCLHFCTVCCTLKVRVSWFFVFLLNPCSVFHRAVHNVQDRIKL